MLGTLSNQNWRVALIVAAALAPALFGCGSTSSDAKGGAGTPSTTMSGGSGGASATGGGTAGASTTGGGTAGGGVSSTGGAGGSSTTPDPDPTSKSGACMLYAKHYCEKLAACQGQVPLSCGLQQYGCPDLLFSDGSTRTIDGIVACVKEWDAFSCASLAAGQEPACITPGTKQPGDACVYPSQCSTLSCSANGVVCGKCQDVAPVGGSCAGGLGCTGLTSCDTATSTCLPFVHLTNKLGDPCPSNGVCSGGLFCSPSAGKTCVAFPELGQPCPDNECDSAAGSYCATDHTCKKSPLPSEPCMPVAGTGNNQFFCGNNNYCDMTAASGPTCVALPTDGMPCLGGECALRNVCDMTGAPTCHALKQKGQACAVFTDCGENLECQNGVCASHAYPGAPCNDGSTVCLPGALCDGTVCQPVDSQGNYKSACGVQ